MGEWLAPGEVRLAPGESITTPEMLATCGVDADAVAQNFHAAIRQRITWPGGRMKPRPVHLNTWEGFYFDHEEAALMELADAAQRSASNASCWTTAGLQAAMTTPRRWATGGPMRPNIPTA